MPDNKNKPHITNAQALMWTVTAANEGVKDAFYQDGRGVPTIGAGYTPVVEGVGDIWAVRDDVKKHFQAAGVPLTPAHEKALGQIALGLNAGGDAGKAEVKAALKTLGDIKLDGEKPQKLFHAVRNEYEDSAKIAVGAETYNRLEPLQQAALYAAAYQSPNALRQAGGKIAAHLAKGDSVAAANEMRSLGAQLKDPVRYNSLGDMFENPKMKGAVMVERGESLSVIAKRHDMTVEQLKEANGLSGDGLRAGQVLKLPAKDNAPEEKTPRSDASSEHAPAEGEAVAALRRDITQTEDPIADILLKPVADWTEGEARDVMKKRLTLGPSDPDRAELTRAERAFFEQTYGTDPIGTDATGRIREPKPKRTPPTTPKTARTRDGVDLGAALSNLGDMLAGRATKTGAPRAVRDLQAGLNRLVADKPTPKAPKTPASTRTPDFNPAAGRPLKVDGILGPKTRRALKRTLVDHGFGTLNAALTPKDPTPKLKPEPEPEPEPKPRPLKSPIEGQENRWFNGLLGEF